jgi:hypothetical protein
MPSQKRNEGRQEYNYEEWQTSTGKRNALSFWSFVKGQVSVANN